MRARRGEERQGEVRVYGDASKTSLLFAANAIPDPLFVPSGRVLKILPAS